MLSHFYQLSRQIWQADFFRNPVHNNHFIKWSLLTVFLYNNYLSITVVPKVAIIYRFDCSKLFVKVDISIYTLCTTSHLVILFHWQSYLVYKLVSIIDLYLSDVTLSVWYLRFSIYWRYFFFLNLVLNFSSFVAAFIYCPTTRFQGWSPVICQT